MKVNIKILNEWMNEGEYKNIKKWMNEGGYKI